MQSITTTPSPSQTTAGATEDLPAQPLSKEPNTSEPGPAARGPRQTRSRVRRQAIIDTAWRLISTRGFDATSVNTIISELGISKGSFYHHFQNKAAVLDAVTELLTRDVSRRVQADHAHASALTRLNAFIRSGWQWQQEHAAISAEMFIVMLRPENLTLMLQITNTEQRVLRPFLHDIIAQGIAEQSFNVPDAEIAADFLMPIFSDTLVRICSAAINNELDAAGFIRQIDFLRLSVERILGAADGALAPSIPDHHSMGLAVEFLNRFQTTTEQQDLKATQPTRAE